LLDSTVGTYLIRIHGFITRTLNTHTHTNDNKDNKETTISQSARATPAHPAPTTSINTTPAAFTL
ncbi:hypothetical protein L9F63_016874, partial [Diploptera punctata]